MRIWMEEHYGEKDHFALKITLYLLLLLAFAITMPVGVTWLALYFKWPITEVTLTTANVNHFFTLLGKMFFTPYGKEFFTYPGKQIFTS